MKILYFDIETAPNLGYTWGKWEQDVIEFEREWYMMSFAYKWAGEKSIHAYALPDFKTYRKDSEDDSELVKKLWFLFDEADVIIGHNGDKFDIKKSNAKFLEHGLPPPSPYKTVDTLKVARKYFALNSNKLNDICQLLKLGEKVETGGYSLWRACLKGDLSAWKRMVKYNKHDVDLLEKVYLKLRNWMTNHPNTNVYNGTTHNCPVCGSHEVQKRGYNVTRTGRYQRYQCGCGAWSQGEKITIDKVVVR